MHVHSIDGKMPLPNEQISKVTNETFSLPMIKY